MFGIDPFIRRFTPRGVVLGLALGLGISGLAAAAPPPSLGGGGAGPEEEACSGRSVGDACTLPNRQLGTCGEGTCSRLDYSGGSPPKAVEEACVVCKPGSGGHSPPPLGSGDSGAGDSGGSASNSPGPSATGPSATGPSSKTDGKEPPESSSRCRVEPNTDGGPAGLAALLALLGLGVRRRRARESARMR